MRSDGAWVGAVAALLVACDLAPTSSPAGAEALSVGASVSRPLSAGQRFAIGPGRLTISARAPGVDIALRVRTSRSADLTIIDDRWMTEADEVAVINAGAGATLEVVSAHDTTATSTLTVRVRAARAHGPDTFYSAVSEAVAQARTGDQGGRSAAVERLAALAQALSAAGDDRLAAFALTEAAAIAVELSKADAADRLERAAAAAHTAGARAAEARAHLHFAQLMHTLSLPREAFAALDRARRAAPRDPMLAAAALTVESNATLYTGRTVEALALARRAVAAAPPNSRLLSDALAAVGWCHVRLGDEPAARSAFEPSLEIARTKGDQRRIGIGLHNIGILHSNLRHSWEEALDYYERAVAVRRRVGDLSGLAFSLDAAGEIESTLKRPGAIDRHREALALRRTVGSRRGEAQTLISLGNALSRLGRGEEALPHLRQGAERMGALGDLHYQAYALFRLGRAYHKLGRFPESVAAARRALAITESQRATIATEEGRTDFVDALRWYFDLYVSAAGDQFAVDGRRRWAAAALDGSERARARALVEMIGRVGLPDGPAFTTDVVESQAVLRAEILELEAAQKRDRAMRAPAAVIEARESEVDAKMVEFARLVRAVERADPRQSELLDAPIVTLDEAQAMVETPSTLLVELYLGAGGAFALAIGSATVAVARLGPQDPIDRVARRLHGHLTARNRTKRGEDASMRARRIESSDQRAGEAIEALRKMVFGPLERLIGAHRLIVVIADGALHYVPFAALLPDHDVITLPSLTVLKVQRSRQRPRPERKLAVIGDPVFGLQDPRVRRSPAPPTQPSLVGRADESVRQLPRLRFSGPEVEAIAGLVDARDRVVRIGFDATRGWATSGALEPYALVHFATHGMLDAAHPERSGLVLAGLDDEGRTIDGYLSLADIYRMRLRAAVVTLSACETALGREVVSEGLIGLTRGFLHAGAERVVASLWKVNDKATQQLMSTFYRGLLRDQLPPPRALRRAQRELARVPRFQAPYYWAGFVLQGDWRDVTIRRKDGSDGPD